MKLNNCLFFAIKEAIKNGKSIVIQRSKHNHNWWFCRYHILVLPKKIVDKYAESFVPDAETLGDWPCPLFKGHIKKNK